MTSTSWLQTWLKALTTLQDIHNNVADWPSNMLTHDCFCPGAEDINAAAEAAEKVTSDVNRLVADLAEGSDNKDAVEDAYEQRWECVTA